MIALSEIPVKADPVTFNISASHAERMKAGLSMAYELEIVRRECAREKMPGHIIQRVSDTINELQAWSSFTDEQIEEILLYVIEKECIFLVTDLAEELVIDRNFVVEAVSKMEKKGLLYKVARYTPGMDRPDRFMYKSRRVENVESSGSMFDLELPPTSDKAWAAAGF